MTTQTELCKYGQDPKSCTSSPMDCQCAIDAALAQPIIESYPEKDNSQPEQEPVAVKHMMEWVDYLKRKSDYGQHLQIPSEMSAGACWELARELEQFITTPPQRTWVGLTDEEMQAVVDAQPLVSSINVYFKAIEAKLKKKNT